jgi:phospholipid/cholesterol/gamma-HCH transport system permease protein
MTEPSPNVWWYVRRTPQGVQLVPRGAWRLANINRIARKIDGPVARAGERVQIEGSQLETIDTAGALLMFELALGKDADFRSITLTGFSPRHLSIADLVRERWHYEPVTPEAPPLTLVQKVGRATVRIGKNIRDQLAFLGEAHTSVWEIFFKPRKLRYREFTVQLEQVCVDAIPIVCLVTALIGIVLAYLFAMQLVKYGANIFVVDGVVLAMCRELSPIVVAITLAGRSGSAFTAQIGTMKINQEIDAMVTTGLSPMQVLVVPRILALVIALPLLCFIGDIVGTLGGLLISHWYVGISGYTFFDRIQSNFPYKSFYFGLMKAPVFAAFIAAIGCRMGLAVENNAQSVGFNTTSTVVQSIVMVIIIDALFAVLFAQAGFY